MPRRVAAAVTALPNPCTRRRNLPWPPDCMRSIAGEQPADHPKQPEVCSVLLRKMDLSNSAWAAKFISS